jgi:hypothetical protein
MSNIGSYQERLNDFDWSLAEKELEYKKGGILNIGWYCSDRICLGSGELRLLKIGFRERLHSMCDPEQYHWNVSKILIIGCRRICLYGQDPELFFISCILKIGQLHNHCSQHLVMNHYMLGWKMQNRATNTKQTFT